MTGSYDGFGVPSAQSSDAETRIERRSLTDGEDDRVGGDDELGVLFHADVGDAVVVEGTGGDPAAAHAGHPPLLRGDLVKTARVVKQTAFLQSLVDVLLGGLHGVTRLEADQRHLFRAQSASPSGAVEGHAAPAQHHHPLSHQDGLAQVSLAKELGVQQNVGEVFAGYRGV